MNCHNCGVTTRTTDWGEWCDGCAGVVTRPGDYYVRHVADVIGQGKTIPILFDYSLGDYTATYIRIVPVPVKGEKELHLIPRTFVKSGSLLEMVTFALGELSPAKVEKRGACRTTEEAEVLV